MCSQNHPTYLMALTRTHLPAHHRDPQGHLHLGWLTSGTSLLLSSPEEQFLRHLLHDSSSMFLGGEHSKGSAYIRISSYEALLHHIIKRKLHYNYIPLLPPYMTYYTHSFFLG